MLKEEDKIQKFFRFLKNKKIYDLYVRNILAHPLRASVNVNDFLNKSVECREYRLLIFNAFSWNKTNEGYCFWSQVNEEWYEYLRKLKWEKKRK